MDRKPRAGTYLILLLLVCLSASSVAEAARVRPVNLEEMTASSGRIFSGQVTAVRVVLDEQLGRPVTLVTLAVERSVKGEPADGLTIRVFGNQDASAGPASGILGLPRFAVGEELVLFLYPPADSGLTSPIGLSQGKFAVYVNAEGDRAARNPFGNAGLFEGLSSAATGALEASGRPVASMESRRLGPDELLDLAAALAGESRRPVGDGPTKPTGEGR